LQSMTVFVMIAWVTYCQAVCGACSIEYQNSCLRMVVLPCGAGSRHDTQEDPTSLSALASHGPLTRQVFISHTGQDKDARDFAACILKPALEAAGLKVYMDFSNLHPGCNWPAELMNAAANSAVVVVVLSQRYTQRFWCMLELDLALNSHSSKQQQQQQQGPLVVPVFYHAAGSIVQLRAIQKYWTAAKPKLEPAERQAWVDINRWTANIHSLKEQLQHQRLPAKGGSKDEALQLARRVVAAAVAAIPVQASINAIVVGTEQQEAKLVAQLTVPDPARLGLWLYGCGRCCPDTLLHCGPSIMAHASALTSAPCLVRGCLCNWSSCCRVAVGLLHCQDVAMYITQCVWQVQSGS